MGFYLNIAGRILEKLYTLEYLVGNIKKYEKEIKKEPI